MPPFRTTASVHRLSQIVDEVVHFAEGKAPPSVVVTEVVALVLRLKERMVMPSELVNLGKTYRQGSRECLRTRALASHPALRISRAS